MKLSAKFGLEVVGKVHLFVEFMFPVGEGALALEFALAIEIPVLAHLGLVLQLVASDELISLHLILESLLGLLDRSLDVLTRILLFYLTPFLDSAIVGTLVIRGLLC
mmetsp:Transcript_11758/g.11686  ORF Transcript_11758/g.11686 Transcript_11758/m.11686 type:complete len:107 (-) Transcript_11758:494-814(-)